MQICPRCSRPISVDDTVELAGARLVHVDCLRPRRLSVEERALLQWYCSDHAIGECASCGQRFRQTEILSATFGDGAHLCPHCRTDLTDSLRAHLYACTMLPQEVRRRAHQARETAQRLVKQSHQLTDRADVLVREAEVALAALRETMSQSTQEGLRHLIQEKLRDGSLPHEGIPSIVSGRPGDGSRCGACGWNVTPSALMMLVPSTGGSLLPLHTDCFQIWNEERRTFQTPS